MTKIIYKTILAGSKPYHEKEKDDYLEFLKTNQDKIYSSEIGVYLGRRININDQNLYFPFIDIDGNNNEDNNLKNDNKIQSAILNASIVYDFFKRLGVNQHFYTIATGNTGFRMLSNILLNEDDYKAFVEFIKKNLPQIVDLQPTEDLEMPHRLFVYNGYPAQTQKELVNRHSVVIPSQMLEGAGTITPEYYKEITKGKPDPAEVIRFMERFLNFKPISDLNALGEFGKKLKDYRKVLDDIKTRNIINLARYRKEKESIAIEIIQEKLLKEKNIRCNISPRGPVEALSFKGLPCPICKETAVNAYAYPPYYSLKCFNSDCPANKKGGVPLIEWSGFHASNKEINLTKNEGYRSKTSFNKNNDLFLNAPTKFESLEDVRAGIWKELENDDDVLFLLTPGIGKTRTTLEYLAKNMSDKLVIYSCLNKRQRDEAFNDIKSLSDKMQKDFSAHSQHFYLLESREDLCLKENQLKEVIKKGCSPTKILCRSCEYKKTCDYYKQREKITSGIYFITHRMLQYLKDLIPNPDLIVLDEDLLKGFLASDGCTKDEMEDLAIILDEEDYLLIEQISILGQKIGRQIKREPKSYPVILNWRKQPDSKYYLLDDLATKNDQTEDEIITRISNTVSKFKNYSQKQLYEKGINLNALNWLKGLISDHHHCSLFINEKGKIYFNVKYITSLNYQNAPIKALDATGIKRVVEIITGRDVKIFKSDVKWNSRRIHIKRDTSQYALKGIKDKQLREKIVATALKNMFAKNILLITPKFLEEKALKIFKEVDKDRNYESHHFFGSRGVNDYKDCDGVIVIGSPYPNITSAWHDAQIIYPNDEDIETRNYWPYSLMLLELLQCIHRIRPVNNQKDKNNKEIVIVSSAWPGIIEKPDKENIIDQSQNKYWKELAIQRLEPYVKKFGFLNPDIGFIANVYVESRKNVAKKFQNNIKRLIEAYDHIFKSQDINFKENSSATNRNITGKDEELLDKYKWIFILKDIYIRKSGYKNIDILLRIKNLSCRSSDISISLSNNKQWNEILTYFKEKYKHFEKFKIKLPNSKGQKVNGVGDKRSVIDFYRQLNQFKIFGTINLDSYEILENRIISIDPIPDEFVVVYVPDFTDIPDDKKSENMLYIGHGSNIIPVSTVGDATRFKDIFNNLIENKTVITNNGKELAKILTQSGLNQCEIHDVVINEKIIRNGDVLPKVIKLEDFFKEYGLCEDVDLSHLIPQLYKVWEKQQRIIDDQNLRNVVKLEKRTIWITANLEITGIGIDVIEMLEYQEEIESKSSYEYKAIDRYFNLVEDDYRVHDNIDQLGMVTGRFSFSALHSVKKAGPLRSFFRAKDGGSGRKGLSLAGESPVVSIVRFRHVVMPRFVEGNPTFIAWCKRPSRPC